MLLSSSHPPFPPSPRYGTSAAPCDPATSSARFCCTRHPLLSGKRQWRPFSQLPMTPRDWRTAVSALPTLVELIERPSTSAAMREQGLWVLQNIANSEHLQTTNAQVEEVTPDLIVYIIHLLEYDCMGSMHGGSKRSEGALFAPQQPGQDDRSRRGRSARPDAVVKASHGPYRCGVGGGVYFEKHL